MAEAHGQGTDSLAVARRIVAAASLAAKEYATGVVPRGGRVTAPAEVDEARQFLDQARLDAPALPVRVRAVADTELGALRAMVDRAAPPDSVTARANALEPRRGITDVETVTTDASSRTQIHLAELAEYDDQHQPLWINHHSRHAYRDEGLIGFARLGCPSVHSEKE